MSQRKYHVGNTGRVSSWDMPGSGTTHEAETVTVIEESRICKCCDIFTVKVRAANGDEFWLEEGELE